MANDTALSTNGRKCCSKIPIKSTVFMKIFQLISVSITFGILRGIPLTFNDTGYNFYAATTADIFCGGVMVSQLIITPLLMLCHHIESLNITQSLLEPAIHLVFCLFSLLSGFIGMAFWTNPSSLWEDEQSAGSAMVAFCFITAILYFLDILVFLGFKCKKPRPQESNA